MPVPEKGSIEMPAPKEAELAPTTKVLHTFPGEEGTQAEVAKVEKGFSVALRDTDANKVVDTVKIYPTEEQAVAAAKEIVKPPEETQVKGVTAKETKAEKPKTAKAPKAKPIDQRFTQEEIQNAEGLLNAEAGAMSTSDRPDIYYDREGDALNPEGHMPSRSTSAEKGITSGGTWRGVKSGRPMHPFFRDNPDLNPGQWEEAKWNKRSAPYAKFMEKAIQWLKDTSPEGKAAFAEKAEKRFANFQPPKSNFVTLKK